MCWPGLLIQEVGPFSFIRVILKSCLTKKWYFNIFAIFCDSTEFYHLFGNIFGTFTILESHFSFVFFLLCVGILFQNGILTWKFLCGHVYTTEGILLTCTGIFTKPPPRGVDPNSLARLLSLTQTFDMTGAKLSCCGWTVVRHLWKDPAKRPRPKDPTGDYESDFKNP